MKTITYDDTKYKLVPIEPTEDMIQTGIKTWNASPFSVVTQYKKMLSVSPEVH